jgi:putative DNA primase/helicase
MVNIHYLPNDNEDEDDEKAPPFSEEALALEFANRHGGEARHVAAWNKWLLYDGRCWRADEKKRVFALSRQLCRSMAMAVNKRTEAKRLASARTVAAVVMLAGVDPRIAAGVEQWDADPWLLNTPGGVLDLRTGAMRRHWAEDYMTKMTAAEPRGDCPKFKAFLDRIMGGDKALIAYLRRAFGYCLTGDTSEQAIFFNHGAGQNGKTVLMSTVSGILGDYNCATPIETFTESRSDRHPTELARLRGARLVTATETEAGRHWAESRLKELTGGEKIAARFMHKDFFEYLPQFKPVISGNHKPRLRSVGFAMRRRVNMIPFQVTIPPDERDPALVEKLKAEWPGILQWMIDGCLDWQEGGLAPPEAVMTATDAYFAGEDGYSNWIADCCEIIVGFWSPSSELFAGWRGYAEKAGLQVGDTKRFREEMERLGFPLKRTKIQNGYVGLRVRQDASEDDLEDDL